MKLSYVTTETPMPWLNKEIKQLIEQKNQFYKRFIRGNKTLLYINQCKALQDELGFLIEKSKNVIKLLALKLTGQY